MCTHIYNFDLLLVIIHSLFFYLRLNQSDLYFIDGSKIHGKVPSNSPQKHLNYLFNLICKKNGISCFAVAKKTIGHECQYLKLKKHKFQTSMV